MEAVDHILLPTDLQQVISTDQAWQYHVVPKSINANYVEFYINSDKYNTEAKDALELLLNKNIVLIKHDPQVIQKTLSKYYRKNNTARSAPRQVQVNAQKPDDFLQVLISDAKDLRSSDIHIEVYEEKCRVRIRIDGLLIERYVLKRDEYPALINKIKILSKLDISEKRLPQDGRIMFEAEGMKFDIRVSVLPTLYGEKVVLRLLSNDATNIDIKGLGFGESELNDYLEGIKKPNGIILISGPTGSGKTTTLYATLKILNKETTNIVTVEDPIEYTLEGINQVQMKESIGLTFASALRTFLRQDPDVIMLGEIRDGETAQMAIRAALTGHLVLSTIHTNSAWGTISRLVDMGVPPFLIAGTINTSVAQRLLRLLCTECKNTTEFNSELLPKNYRAPRPVKMHAIAVGCDHCHYTGYKGRKAIYEVIPVDYELAENIRNNNMNVSELLKRRKVKSISEKAFELFESGLTSLEEAYAHLMNNF